MDLMTASSLLALPKQYYPIFDICHILLCVLTVRKEAGKQFAHDHPLATLVSCLISCFAGSLLANPLLGKPMYAAFSDEKLLILATLIYLLVFFSPGDVFYTLVKIKPIYIPICCIKEVYRAKKIYGGLQDGMKVFPDSKYFIPVLTAVIKGNGSAFMAPFARGVRGTWDLTKTEIMKPSVTTKECFLAAVFFAHLGTPDLIYLSLVGLFLSVKLGTLFETPVDPFKPTEAIIFAILDNLSKVKTE